MRNQQHILILGAGESGVGAALLAQKSGLPVFVSDAAPIRSQFRTELLENDIRFEEGGHSNTILENVQIIIKSPGIPNQHPVLTEANKRHLDVISEIEFASRFTKAKLVGVTGSNGKTTTTSLIGHVLKANGHDACVCGNIGLSFARCLSQSDHDIFVLELSSYQLEHMFSFKADVAVLTNITPDHMDRYDHDVAKYCRAKFRITRNQTPQNAFVYNADDPLTMKFLNEKTGQANTFSFSLEKKDGQEAWVENETVVVNHYNEPITMKIESLALQGKHNLYNTMAAAVASKMFDFRKDTLKKSFQTFQKIEHRLEFVAKVHGVSYFNDSKATNVNSVWYALESMKSPIIWIAGGVDKGNEYGSLIPLVKEKVKALICLGTDNQALKQAFADHTEMIIETQSMTEAVNTAYHLGNPGDVVLLSPACASFDLFENYEDRGNQFKNAIREL